MKRITKLLVFSICCMHLCNCMAQQIKKKGFVGPFKIDYIKSEWSKDTCGGNRDSIANILENQNLLIGFSEKDIYYLLGKPSYSGIYNNGRLFKYVIIGQYNESLGRCDPDNFVKVLDIGIDTATNKVNYCRTWEE